MAVNNSIIGQPSAPERQTSGQAVSATLRRPKYGREIIVSTPDTATGAIQIRGNSRITFVLEAGSGNFGLEICYGPVFDANGELNEAGSKWVEIGTASVGGTGKVKQTFEDIAYAYRLVRKTGSGTFIVYDWQMP